MSSNSSIHNVSKVDFEKMDLGEDRGYVYIVTATDKHGYEHSFNMFMSKLNDDVKAITWKDYWYVILDRVAVLHGKFLQLHAEMVLEQWTEEESVSRLYRFTQE